NGFTVRKLPVANPLALAIEPAGFAIPAGDPKAARPARSIRIPARAAGHPRDPEDSAPRQGLQQHVRLTLLDRMQPPAGDLAIQDTVLDPAVFTPDGVFDHDFGRGAPVPGAALVAGFDRDGDFAIDVASIRLLAEPNLGKYIPIDPTPAK